MLLVGLLPVGNVSLGLLDKLGELGLAESDGAAESSQASAAKCLILTSGMAASATAPPLNAWSTLSRSTRPSRCVSVGFRGPA